MIFKDRWEFPTLLTAHGLTGVGVEVGVYRGEFAEHILSHWPGTYHGVDPWKHQPGWDDLLNHTQPLMDAVSVTAHERLAPWIVQQRCHLHRIV